MSEAAQSQTIASDPTVLEDEPSAQEKILQNAANEIVFAVVGHVGSGTSEVTNQLRLLLGAQHLIGGAFDVEVIKARSVIESWAEANGRFVPATRSDVATTIALQDLGDQMRKADHSAVAEGIIREIRSKRAEKLNVTPAHREAVRPNGARRAYIVDSLRHPAEVELLRRVYQDAFVLIGVVCEEEIRRTRLMEKYQNAGSTKAQDLMQRDAKGGERHGQRVSDTFHMSDFFIDNSERRTIEGIGNEDWKVGEHLSRLVKIVTHAQVVRPTIAETAMHHAYSASLRSACLSRQVGAALVDKEGNVVATGTNDVPRAGGGIYGETFDEHAPDHRCAFQETAFCSNTKHQNLLIKHLIDEIPELKNLDENRKEILEGEIRRGGVGDLLEYSRAVHAEMDALLTAGRTGTSTVACRLFVTTFPCHYCARHIVSAGIDEVQYIEPYPKSQALGLHKDSIQTAATNWEPPSAAPTEDGGRRKVLFRPFVGTAPRMYRRAFLKTRELKVKGSGLFEMGVPEWGTPWHLGAVGYADLEASLGPGESAG